MPLGRAERRAPAAPPRAAAAPRDAGVPGLRAHARPGLAAAEAEAHAAETPVPDGDLLGDCDIGSAPAEPMLRFVRVIYQPEVPDSPLKGPTSSGVIQPP